MQIAILGNGNVGKSIGSKWEQAGHEVTYGVRHPEASQAANHLPIGEAIVRSQVVLFAVPGPAVEALAEAYAADLDGRILIDATNNMRGNAMSGVDQLLQHAPSAKIFRAFNSLGWENFANPVFGTERADLVYCGSDDAQASAAVAQLIRDAGLRPVRLGDLDKLGVVDSVVRLWFALASSEGRGRHTAFRVLSD